MTAQQLQTEKLRMVCFATISGRRVADLLARHSDLWIGYVFGRYQAAFLVELRDVHWCVNANTLYLRPRPGQEDALFALCQQFGADDLDFIGGREACDLLGMWTPEVKQNPKALIHLWWD
jgi:hypothetical protein